MTNAIEKLILLEARLLDDGKLDDWLDLYTQDATYWLPIDEHADPLKDSSIIYDNQLRLQMRVEQMMRESRVSHTPLPNIVHIISGIDIEEMGPTSARARYALLVAEVRSGDWRQRGLGETRLLPGHCIVDLDKQGDQWKIRRKKVILVNRKQPIVGLSYLI